MWGTISAVKVRNKRARKKTCHASCRTLSTEILTTKHAERAPLLSLRPWGLIGNLENPGPRVHNSNGALICLGCSTWAPTCPGAPPSGRANPAAHVISFILMGVPRPERVSICSNANIRATLPEKESKRACAIR